VIPTLRRILVPLSVVAIASVSVSTPAIAQKQVAVAAADPWLGPDKLKHFFIAAFVESVAFAGLEAVGADRNASLPAALTAVAVVSVGREVHDGRTKGLFSIKDLTFDALGAAAAFFLLRHTQR
jgi:putative lipoprotein